MLVPKVPACRWQSGEDTETTRSGEMHWSSQVNSFLKSKIAATKFQNYTLKVITLCNIFKQTISHQNYGDFGTS